MISIVKGAIGIIQSIDPINYTASVMLKEYEDKITKHLQILAPLTYGNKVSCIPKVGTSVIVIFLGENADNGFIIGSYYSQRSNCNEKENEFKINYQNATLTIKEDGNIDITATLTKIDSNVEITGQTTIHNDLIVDKTVTAQGLNSTGSAKAVLVEADEVKYGKLTEK